MHYLDNVLVDKIANSCMNLYERLPKTGKPIKNEWTVLSCVVKFDNSSNDIEVISLGTGSKCIGASKMSPTGVILNDSHAEVFARRAFMIYLYENIDKALKNESSIFQYGNRKLKLKENIEFIFYSSQLPCGDASIIPKSGVEENYGDIISNKREAEGDICEVESKRARLYDIYRTGGKCLPNSKQDPKLPGKDYHVVAEVRTKPGRGDRTLSVSCSDKIARWIHFGIQGALLDLLCEPIYIKYYIFGSGVPFSKDSLNRALLNRDSEVSLKPKVQPSFYQSSQPFQHIRTENNMRPAATSIVWVKLNDPLLEVAVQGKKLGVTKKNKNSPKSSLCISKYSMYKSFLNLLNRHVELKQSIIGNEDINSIPYNVMKRKSKRYAEEWSNVKNIFFKNWTVKPDIWNFCINNEE